MLAVVIVSWNVRALLEQCLRSLSTFPCTLTSQRVIVVDNASTDGTVDMLRERFPNVDVIANTENRGFTGGNNDGLKLAQTLWSTRVGARLGQTLNPGAHSNYALLLNPDTEVSRGALDELVGYAEADAQAGVVGPQLRYPDGRVQSSRRRFPTLALAKVESTWAQARAPQTLLDHYYMRDLTDDQTSPVDWIVGAAMLVRAAAIDAAGVLDEDRFFMYSEELDWCKRIKEAGWRIVYHPRAVITHHEGQSSKQVSTKRMIYFNTSKVRYFEKHHGAQQAEALRQSLLGQFRGQLRLERIKHALGQKRALRAERIAAYRAVIASELR